MDHRDVSKNEPEYPSLSQPNAPLDLFSLDLSSELPAIETGGFEQIGDDPFAADLKLSPTDDPFAVEVAAEITEVEPVDGSLVLASAVQATAGVQLGSGTDAVGKLQPVMQEGEATPESEAVSQSDLVRRRYYLTALPSWAISFGVHVAVLFLLAAISLNPIQEAIGVALESGGGEEGDSMESFDLKGPEDPGEADVSEEAFGTPSTMVSEVVSMPEISTAAVSTVAATSANSLSFNNATENLLPSTMRGSSLGRSTNSMNGRSGAMKGEMLERFGGNANSEKSVALALKWIADHQAPNGGWSFAHSQFCRSGQCKDDGTKFRAVNGATAMAILPFLGAGQTHLSGQYKGTIKKGLAFLINNMKATPGQTPRGSWHEPDGNMYSHGLASIAICEAYGMTRDPDLVQPAQLAINYLVYAQDPRGGGWRYSPQQEGDTSVVGWCVMALKSGSMANLSVPQTAFRGASGFLDFVQINNGAYYGYDRPTANFEGRQATTAVGLLCRMYMGSSKENEGIKEGVAFLSKKGPAVDNLYYSYYATQVMRHNGGPEWERWNTKMRDDLIKAQEPSGHAAGSWYSAGGHGRDGGRLCCTSLATMILEVYYRHMPLYTEKSSQDDFEL